LQIHPVCREVGADKRTVLLITEPANERDPGPKDRSSNQRGCDVSTGLPLTCLDSALVVGLTGIDI
jgi:hypothetical protein